jgi:hypothetical protein
MLSPPWPIGISSGAYHGASWGGPLAVGRTFPQVYEVGEPFVPDQFEECEIARNRPAIGPKRWRKLQGSVHPRLGKLERLDRF